MAAVAPPSARRCTYTTRSAASSSSGLVVSTIVVRPARCARRPRAILASVCASTALVGSTRTRISGSASSARASRTPLRLTAGERAAAGGQLAVESARHRLQHVRRRRYLQRGPERVASSAPAAAASASRSSRATAEQVRVRRGDQDPGAAPRRPAGRPAARRRAPAPGPSGRPYRPSRSASADRLVRAVGGDHRGTRPAAR